MEIDPTIAQLHKHYEAIRPKALIGEDLKRELNNLFEFIKESFNDHIKRPDGSRVYQALYRRADAELRTKFLELFIPIIIEASMTKYQYHVVLCVIKHSNKEQRNLLFEKMIGNLGKLIKHRIGILIVDELYDHANSTQKARILFDFYGPHKDKYDSNSLTTFADLCKLSPKVREESIKYLQGILEVACDKNLGKYRIIQKMILNLGQEDLSMFGHFIIHLNDFAFSPDGAEVAIRCIINAKQSAIRGAIKFIEPHERKNMPLSAIEEDDHPDNEEEEGNESDQKAPEEVQMNNTCKMACDANGWRVLACAVSYLDDPAAVIEEVIPNLMDYWGNIASNEYALSLISSFLIPSKQTYRSLQFLRSFVNETLEDNVSESIFEKVCGSIDTLCTFSDGSRIVVHLLKAYSKTDRFNQLADIVFSHKNILDKVLHKVIKLAVQSGEKPLIKRVETLVHEVGVEAILPTPGAWVIEALSSINKKIRENAIRIINQNKIEGKAIQAILDPKSDKEKVSFSRQKYSKK